MNTEENNRLIAQFMGVDTEFSNEVYKDSKSILRHIIHNRSKKEGLEFHKNWSWLMPVLEKIESLGFCTELIGGNHNISMVWDKSFENHLSWKGGGSKIQNLYEMIVDFIKWHNEQTQQLTDK